MPDIIASSLLAFIKVVLDDNGAWDWNLRVVAGVSMMVLYFIKVTCRKAYGIDWYSQVNAIVTGLGAASVAYLDAYASEELTGTPEFLRSAQCAPPLTSLHRVVPAIAMGYAVIDIIDGFTYGPDFFFHGLATFSVMAFACEQDRTQFIAPVTLMECSTIFLNMRGATFLGDTGSLIVQALFALTFFLTRIVIVPTLHYNMMSALFATAPNGCDPPYFKWAVLFFGLSFHVLNSFWFYKLLLKIQRKVSGQEKIRDKLELQTTTKDD